MQISLTSAPDKIIFDLLWLIIILILILIIKTGYDLPVKRYEKKEEFWNKFWEAMNTVSETQKSALRLLEETTRKLDKFGDDKKIENNVEKTRNI